MTVVNTLSKELRMRGLTTGVVAVAPENEIECSKESWPGALWVEPLILSRTSRLLDYRAAARMSRTVKSAAVLAHTHRIVPGWMIGRPLNHRRTPLIVVEHHAWNDRRITDEAWSLSALAFADGLVFLSLESRDHYRLWPAARVRQVATRIVPNGIDTLIFRPGENRRSIGPLHVGTVGRLVRGKDFGLVLDAVAMARSEGMNLRLMIAGQGPEYASLRDRTVSLGLTDVVHFVGEVRAQDMPEFLRGLDVFVHASKGETLSMALLEAAAAQLPIVACSVPGVKNIYTDGVDALLVPPNDASALAAAIRKAADPAVATLLGANARRLVEENYSSTRMAEGYLELLRIVAPSGPWGPSAVGAQRQAP